MGGRAMGDRGWQQDADRGSEPLLRGLVVGAWAFLASDRARRTGQQAAGGNPSDASDASETGPPLAGRDGPDEH